MTKKLVLWRHQMWRHKNEIWEFKSDKSFNFMCTVFLQSISFRLHTYEEETFGSFDFLIGH